MNQVVLNLLSMFFSVLAIILPLIVIIKLGKINFAKLMTYLSMSSLSIALLLLLYDFSVKLQNDQIANLKEDMQTTINIYSVVVIVVLALNFIVFIFRGIIESKKSSAVKKVEKDMAKKEEKKEDAKAKKQEKKDAKANKKEEKSSTVVDDVQDEKSTDIPVLEIEEPPAFIDDVVAEEDKPSDI